MALPLSAGLITIVLSCAKSMRASVSSLVRFLRGELVLKLVTLFTMFPIKQSKKTSLPGYGVHPEEGWNCLYMSLTR